MTKSILLLPLLSLACLGLGSCAGRSEVSYEIPPHRATPPTAGTRTGVDPNPGTDASAVGGALNPGR